eukprot:TRINITY_DN15020_c0_g1_i2.p1 TRINITY_DN15020_c0_g1~~TRINITY_DN15020_c0_g1_i2.p1  ORF type:complete len:480 (-),score=66.30 TRINITY_DN15020_c0_g1_i2:283-1722(-)
MTITSSLKISFLFIHLCWSSVVILSDGGVGFLFNGTINPTLYIAVGEEVSFINTIPSQPISLMTNSFETKELWNDGVIINNKGDQLDWFVSPKAEDKIFWYYSSDTYYGRIVVLPPPEDCGNLPDGRMCDDLNPCSLLSTCANGTCLGFDFIECATFTQCKEGQCDPTSGLCVPVNVSDGSFCNISEDGGTWATMECSFGLCTGVPRDWNGFANFYLISLWSVGGSLFVLGVMMKQPNWHVNPFFILPSITLVAATTFVIIDLNFLINRDISEKTARGLIVTQWCVDAISTICIELAYFWRLRVAVQVAIRVHSIPFWVEYVLWVMLIPPLSYPICDIIAICALYSPTLANAANGKLVQIVTGVWAIIVALNDLFMHGGFIIMVLNMAMGKKDAAVQAHKRSLVVIAIILGINPLGYLIGGIVNLIEPSPQIGTILIYSFWLNNVFVFLLLNLAISRLVLDRKTTGHSTRGQSATDRTR